MKNHTNSSFFKNKKVKEIDILSKSDIQAPCNNSAKNIHLDNSNNNSIPDNKTYFNYIEKIIENNLSDIKDELNKKFLKFQYNINSQLENSTQKTTKTNDDDKKYLLDLITAQKINCEKIPEIIQKIDKIETKTNAIDISNSVLRIDFDKACGKYDKIFIDNLQIPGKVGTGCKFKNLRELFILMIDDIKDLKLFKEQCQKEIKAKQERTDKLMEQARKEIELFRESNLSYFGKKINPLEKKFDDKLIDVQNQLDKINNDCIQNSYISVKLEHEIKKIIKDIQNLKLEEKNTLEENIKKNIEKIKIENKELLTINGLQKNKNNEMLKYHQSFEYNQNEPQKNSEDILKKNNQIPKKLILKKGSNKINLVPEKLNKNTNDDNNSNKEKRKSITHSSMVVANKNHRFFMELDDVCKTKTKILNLEGYEEKTHTIGPFNIKNFRRNSSQKNSRFVTRTTSKENIKENFQSTKTKLSKSKLGECSNSGIFPVKYSSCEMQSNENDFGSKDNKKQHQSDIHLKSISTDFYINTNDINNINTINNQLNLDSKTKKLSEDNLGSKFLPSLYKNDHNTNDYKDMTLYFDENNQSKMISENKLTLGIKSKNNNSEKKEGNINIFQNIINCNSSTCIPEIKNNPNKYKKTKQGKTNISLEKIPCIFKKTTKMQYKKKAKY